MLAWVKCVATSFVFVLIGSTFYVIKNFSFGRRWRFTFYLCIFIYGLQFLWQVSRSAEHKDIFCSSIVCSLDINIQSNLLFKYNIYFLVSLDVGHKALLVRLPLSGTVLLLSFYTEHNPNISTSTQCRWGLNIYCTAMAQLYPLIKWLTVIFFF